MPVQWNALMNMPNAGESFTNAFNQARQQKQQEELVGRQMQQQDEDRQLRREEIEHQRGTREQQARKQQLEEARERISMMGRLLEGATPENYGQRLQAAAGMGLDVSQVPPQFDPNWIEMTKQQAQALMGKLDQELMAVAPGTTVIDKRTGQPVYTNPRAPRYIPVQPGGKLVLDPSSVGGALPQSAGDDEWEYEGGPTPQASGGFPR